MPAPSKRVLATERAITSAKAKGERSEFRIKGAKNLILRVTETGAKSWVLLYRSPATGQKRKFTIGSFPTIGLEQAIIEALALTVVIREGRDPASVEEPCGTFAALAKQYMAEHEKRNARGEKVSRWTIEVQRLLDRDVLPVLGRFQVEAIRKKDVASVVESVAGRASYRVADQVLGLVRSIFNWGNATGRLEVDPTRGLKKRNGRKPRDRVLKDDEIRILWARLDVPSGLSDPVRDALKLQLLLGLRVGEALGAAKSEIDLEQCLWTVPAIRTKSNREHKLPLSPMAVSILKVALERSPSSPWLLPSPHDGQPVRQQSASRALMRMRRKLGIDDIGTHDLRRTLATRLGDAGVPDEVIGRILNHAPPSITGKIYNRTANLEPLREALDAWATELAAIIGT